MYTHSTSKEYIKKTGIKRIVPSRDYYWLHRLKATPTRIQILDLLKSVRTPMSAKEICEKLPDIHRATIFRTLKALVIMDIIWKIYPCTRKRAMFEIKPIS